MGKPFWKSTLTSELALNAGIARNLSISSADVENYGPFVYFYFENLSDETIEIHLDGAAVGDNTLIGTKQIIKCPSGQAKELTPYQDGRPDIIFQRVAIKNTSATNTSNDELKWVAKNW